jgi:predicted nucleic acid-binding protein
MTKQVVVVPDTSVLLKWVLESEDEKDRDRALSLRESWLSGECTIVLPSLWFFETANILGMKQPSLAPELMRTLAGYNFPEERPGAISGKAFELMKRFNVTFYDAAYHAVAIRHTGTFVTADDTYVRKTLRAGHVQLLSNWSSRQAT